MKQFLTAVICLISLSTFSQTNVKVGENGMLIKVEKPKVELPTSYKYTVKDVEYPVFKTEKGKYFVNLYSEEKKKNYRRYLKLVE